MVHTFLSIILLTSRKDVKRNRIKKKKRKRKEGLSKGRTR